MHVRFPFFWSLALLFVAGLADLAGQSREQAFAREQAINRYIAFHNECLHLLYETRAYLEDLNEAVVVAEEENRQTTLSFPFQKLYRNGKMYTFLQGTCARTSNEVDQGLDLEQLYKAAEDNQALSYSERAQLQAFRNEGWQVMLNVLSTGYSLMDLTLRSESVSLSTASVLELLASMETAYAKIADLNHRFRRYLDQTVQPVPAPLQPFQAMITNGESLLYAIRSDNESGIMAARQSLLQSVELSRQSRTRYNRELWQLGIRFDDEEEENAYDHAVEYGGLLLQRSQPELLSNPARGSWSRYPVRYIHFNERVLDLYNHHKYGLTSYYQTLLDHSNQIFVHPLDVAPWFMVIYPREPEPEPETLPVISMDPPEPETEELSLSAAPVNNLVFLIDASASMNRPEKLPLFKENLEFLVSLFRPEDKIAIVTFSGDATVVLEATPGMFPSEITTAIRSIRTGGDTKVKRGFREAYQIAESEYLVGGTNKVILITDGIFETDRGTENSITRYADMDILLSVIYLGNREAPQVRERLTQLAELGEGRYSHFHTDNAKEVLVSEARGQ